MGPGRLTKPFSKALQKVTEDIMQSSTLRSSRRCASAMAASSCFGGRSMEALMALIICLDGQT